MKLTYETAEHKMTVEVTAKELAEFVAGLNAFIKLKSTLSPDVKPESTIEPDWATAPDWANWWAVDESGIAYWFYDEPFIDNVAAVWENSSVGGDFDEDAKFDLMCSAWKTTLRKRPGVEK